MSDGGGQLWTDQFIDSSGTPYGSVKVYHYATGTTTDKTVWTDEARTTAAAQPVVGDAAGRVSFYGDGDYKLVVKSSADVILYTFASKKLTSDTGTMWEGNYGTSFPTAAAANLMHMFAKTTAGNALMQLGINTGSAFQAFASPLGRGADIASASSITLGTDGNFFHIIGTTGIAAIATRAVGSIIHLAFDGILTITHNATSMILPDGDDIVTRAGTILSFVEESAGNWRAINLLDYQKQLVMKKGSDVASASSITLALGSAYFDITGTATTAGIVARAVGSIVICHFDSALTLTHHATDFMMPGGGDLAVEAGNEVIFYEYESGKWRVLADTVPETTQFKIGVTTKDQADASGTQAITGIGFTPRLLLVMAIQNASSEASIGMTDGTTDRCMADTHAVGAGQWEMKATIVFCEQGGATSYSATISSLDSDGFTFNWTKSGGPTGIIQIVYLAIR